MKKNLKPGMTITNYKLEERLSKGTFSETWKALSLENNASVAMQFMQYETLTKLVQHSVNKIPRPENSQIAKFIQWDYENGVILWEYLPGRQLETFIYQLKKIKISIAVYIARKILEALAFAVAQGYTHGALRPRRILVTADKKIKLTNFGMGIFEQQVLYSLAQKNNPFAKDIEHYFAPEILEDRIFDDPKSDIYSVGVILTEMLIGKSCLRQEIPKLLYQNDIPKSLMAIILKSVSDFGLRYNHPNEMHTDLTRLLKISETTNKLYVEPPSIEKQELEAVPADSEEYRIYQEDDAAARQTIDAKVVDAEPDYLEDMEQERLTEQEAKQEIKKILQKTGRIDVNVMFGTFDDKILTPLEKIPIWPQIFLKYTMTASIIIVFAMLFTYAPKSIVSIVDNIFLFPYYILKPWSPIMRTAIILFVCLHFIALYALPFWDYRGKFALSSFFIPFYTTTMAGLVGFSLWKSVATSTAHGVIITVIFLLMGIVIGMMTPHLSRFLRKQW